MKRIRTGFTLGELIVVLVVILVLSAVLYPVFLSAKNAALKTMCASNLHQASLAMDMYVRDYDDFFTPVNYEPGKPPDPTGDRTWVQLLLPYARSFAIFHDPADTSPRENFEGTFDEDLVPYDTYARYYMASLRSDIGFNYIYLSPIVKDSSGDFISDPVSTTNVQDPSKTLLYIDSVWARNGSGQPYGGGSWLVIPPCKWEVEPSGLIDTFALSPVGGTVVSDTQGWSGNSASNVLYGHAWPWHTGFFNVAHVDGSISSVSAPQLESGCDYQPKWQGYILDPSSYIWAR